MTDPLLIEIPRVLAGNGIELRAYEASDALAIHEAVVESQEELKKVFDWASHLPSLEQRAAGMTRGMACWTLRTELAFGIWSATDQTYLGDTGIFSPEWNVRFFEFGYWLPTNAVGHGYATEAVRVLVGFNVQSAQRPVRLHPVILRKRA
jgi:RimJ/RimL family protein N-acetyltransferase